MTRAPEFYTRMDAANVDVKGFTDAFYHRLCFAQLRPVLDTLKYLRHETNAWFEVTTLLIRGVPAAANYSSSAIDTSLGNGILKMGDVSRAVTKSLAFSNMSMVIEARGACR